MNIVAFLAAYFALGGLYHHVLGRVWRLAEKAMQESNMLGEEIAVFKFLAVVFWPLFLFLDIIFPE